jgi:hypothetical protein
MGPVHRLDRRLVHHKKGITAGLDIRNPGEDEQPYRDTDNTMLTNRSASGDHNAGPTST